MSAYWIGRARVHDPIGMKRYGELVAKASAIYKPQALVRGERRVVLEGPDDFERQVVLRFDSVEAAVRYYNSPEYQEAAAVRQSSCERCELVLVEGLD